jgi:SAM-dependent methyltransferase
MNDVRDFFERSADGYRAVSAGMAAPHRITAARIQAGITGDVLSLGGMWAQASDRLEGVRLFVADLSLAMLRSGEAPSAWCVACDGQLPPFRDVSFDHIVLPLVLHHVTGRSFTSAQAGATLVLQQMRRLTRPGGRLWISDFCTSSALYALQRLLAPATRRILAAFQEPLVVMHTETFYRAALERTGWSDIVIDRVRSEEAGSFDGIRPLIAVPWLKVPRFAYPVRPTLITAAAS